jgi:hypothetical protein
VFADAAQRIRNDEVMARIISTCEFDAKETHFSAPGDALALAHDEFCDGKIERRSDMRTYRRAAYLFLTLLSTPALSVAQEAVVVDVRADGVVVDTSQMPDARRGAKLGFVRVEGARTEVGHGLILDSREGRALVQTDTGSAREGDLAVLCPEPEASDAHRELRAVADQLRAQPGEAGMIGEQLKTAIEAREIAVKKGACDTAELDARISSIATELNNAGGDPPGGSQRETSPEFPDQSSISPPQESHSGGAMQNPLAAPEKGSVETAVDALDRISKIVERIVIATKSNGGMRRHGSRSQGIPPDGNPGNSYPPGYSDSPGDYSDPAPVGPPYSGGSPSEDTGSRNPSKDPNPLGNYPEPKGGDSTSGMGNSRFPEKLGTRDKIPLFTAEPAKPKSPPVILDPSIIGNKSTAVTAEQRNVVPGAVTPNQPSATAGLPWWQVPSTKTKPSMPSATANKTDGVKANVGSAVNAKPATVTGRVMNEKGQPLTNAAVSIGALGRTTTNSDGKFTFQSITPGEHQITAAASGFRIDSRTLRLAAGGIETINFTLRAADTSSSPKPAVPAIQKRTIPLRDIKPQQKLPQVSIPQRK